MSPLFNNSITKHMSKIYYVAPELIQNCHSSFIIFTIVPTNKYLEAIEEMDSN